MKISHIDGLLWTPIRTKPKKEKKLAEYCIANNISYYLPLRKSVKRYERKTVTFYPPMFSGYIFCQLSYDLYNLLVRSHDVFFKVDVDNVTEVQLIKDLQNIQKVEVLSKQKEVKIKPELTEGKAIVITNGPLEGTSGIITSRDGGVIITVNVEILGQSVSVKMDIGEMELEK